MAEIKIQADSREKIGVKGELSRIRAEQKVPAVIYGGKKEPISIAVSQKDIASILKSGANTIVTLNTASGVETALVKDIQYHVVKDIPNHVDFQRISMSDKIEVIVPIKLVGESADVKIYGALINQVMRDLHVICLPADIPHEIEADLSKVTVHHALTIAELNIPANIEVIGETNRVVVSLVAPKDEEIAPAAEATAAQPESSSTKGKKDEEGNVAKK
ncbi:large subunit ribosomal protein L25 [Elusimicrobium posterum]|uniref:50S ribosomal protein L25 n=1 Tax=Elusimicrobium posterum TaxID=3116653 RepID=UPI003C759C31